MFSHEKLWPPRLPSVSRSLHLLAGTLLLAILLVTLHQLWVLRDAIISDTQRQLDRLDMVLAEQTGQAVATVDMALRDAIEAGQDPERRMESAAFDRWLQRRLSSVELASTLLLADREGIVTGATVSPRPSVLPADAQVLLNQYRAGARGVLISAPTRMPDGNWIAFLSRPIEATSDDAGAPRLEGIALAAMKLGFFDEFYRSIDLSEGGAVGLFHRDGTMLSRHPPVGSMIGANFASMPAFRDILAAGRSGTLVRPSPVDGNMRVIAVRALRSFPLAVIVSVDQSRLLAGWWRQAVLFAAAALLVAVLLVVFLLKLAERSREVERLLRETQDSAAKAEGVNRQLRDQMVERQRAEAALSQAQRMGALGQLTGGVAHDFNNLLTVLLSNIDMLDRAPRAPESQTSITKERLATMRAAAMRGASLTGHLLAFARRQPLVPTAVDLNRLVDDMRHLLRSALGGRIRIDLDLAGSLWPTMVDPTQIELAILNLAINARDAMDGVGVLTITTENRLLAEPEQPEEPACGPYVTVSVRDTGSGMTPEVRDRVFEPFFTTKAPGAGSGLGLSQVVGTARQAAGGVRIDSSPGHGTTVSIFLPRANVGVERRPASGPGTFVPGRTARILLVDDDEPVRVVTAALLRDLGYEVREAASAAVALRVLDAELGIDLLLTDLAMPFMTGAQLARAALARRPGLPVVFISGYADPETLAGAGESQHLVRKPFRPDELRDQIEAALGAVETA